MFLRVILICRNQVAFHRATRLDPLGTKHMFLYALFIYHLARVAVKINSSTPFPWNYPMERKSILRNTGEDGRKHENELL
jgi:hypothetical protein